MEEKRILLVEDEQKIADTLKLGLTENDYTVDIAYDGKTGLELFKLSSYDLIVLDINLPDISGFEFCKTVRSENDRVLIIMLTALNSISNKIEGYDAGADDYIIKPFEFKEFLMKVRALLKRMRGQIYSTTNILKAADLEMNLDSKQVRRGNIGISLTAKEFQLLEYLLRNKNRVVSRADIAIKVWDINFDTNTNVIDVYINYVRKKIDRNFKQKLIQTHVGMGYILKENG